MSGMTLTDTEVTALRAVADPAHVREPGPAVSWSLLEAVRTLVGADEVELDQTDPGRRWLGFMQSLDGRSYVSEDADDPYFWELWWSTEACVLVKTGPQAGATMLSDFLSAREWRQEPMYVVYTKPSGLFHELGVNLPDSRGRSLRLHCWRSPGRDFSERDRFLLSLLRPHIAAAYRAAERQRQPIQLTPRQLELLAQVRRGLTNRQVARVMGLSEGTVRRHLENIYERLGVSSRTEAVARLASVEDVD